AGGGGGGGGVPRRWRGFSGSAAPRGSAGRRRGFLLFIRCRLWGRLRRRPPAGGGTVAPPAPAGNGCPPCLAAERKAAQFAAVPWSGHSVTGRRSPVTE